MKRCFVLILFCLALALGVYGSEEKIKEGNITLETYSFARGEGTRNTIQIGEKVIFYVDAYISEFFNEPIINANAKMVNTTNKPMRAIYDIRFYDDLGNIVGAHATSWDIKPNDEVNYGSGMIRVKEEDFERVTKYKLSVCSYETVAKD